MLSWGYLIQRAYALQINLGPLVSRVPTASADNRHSGNESTASALTKEIRVTGRIMLNIWRLMRHEVFHSYAFCNTQVLCWIQSIIHGNRILFWLLPVVSKIIIKEIEFGSSGFLHVHDLKGSVWHADNYIRQDDQSHAGIQTWELLTQSRS